MNDPAAASFPASSPLVQRGPAHPCPYLAGRTAVNEYMILPSLPPAQYLRLMDAGFRRSGDVVYRPACDDCRECVPMRIPVATFSPSRSQRRVLKRNAEVEVRIGPPRPDDNKHRLFSAYLRHQHDGTMSDDRSDFEQFLYHSSTQTLEMTYHAEGRLVAVGIVDVCPTAISSVYFYFDPAESKRSLGVFGGLREIEECRRRGLPYWYLGYFVRDCRSMNYKASFGPHELLDARGNWHQA